MSYRNPKLLKLASEAPRCMNPVCGKPNSGDIVACHSNSQRHGKGMGLKAHDAPAYLCSECHDYLDGRKGSMCRADRERMFLESAYETWVWLMESGYLRVVVEVAA